MNNIETCNNCKGDVDISFAAPAVANGAQDELPPLPEPFMDLQREISPVVYSHWADQMHDYARAAIAVAGPNATLVEALKSLYKDYVRTLEAGRDRILDLGGDCDSVDYMESSDPGLYKARAALASVGVKGE